MEFSSQLWSLSVPSAPQPRFLVSHGLAVPRRNLRAERRRLSCKKSDSTGGSDDKEDDANRGLKSALKTLDSYFDRLEKTKSPSAPESCVEKVTLNSPLSPAKSGEVKETHDPLQVAGAEKLKSLQDDYALKEELLLTVLKEFEQATESKDKEAAAAAAAAAAENDRQRKLDLDLNEEETPLVVLKSSRNSKNEETRKEVPLLLLRRGSMIASTLVGINIGVYIFGLATSQQAGNGMDLAFTQGAKVNELILDGEWWRLITPTFLHSGFLHLFLSCWAIISFGPLVESLYGSIGLILIFLLGGAMGNLASFFQTPDPTVGGTGAVFAVICSWIVFLVKNREAVRTFDTGELLQKVIIFSGLCVLLGNDLPIDAWSHVGGAVVGILFGAVASPWYQITTASQLEGSRTDLTLEKLALALVLCSGALLCLYYLGLEDNSGGELFGL